MTEPVLKAAKLPGTKAAARGFKPSVVYGITGDGTYQALQVDSNGNLDWQSSTLETNTENTTNVLTGATTASYSDERLSLSDQAGTVEGSWEDIAGHSRVTVYISSNVDSTTANPPSGDITIYVSPLAADATPETAQFVLMTHDLGTDGATGDKNLYVQDIAARSIRVEYSGDAEGDVETYLCASGRTTTSTIPV